MQRIQQELQCSRIAGPFIEPPFPNIQVPPPPKKKKNLVPKKSLGEYCLINHLFFPKRDSIYYNIPQKFCSVQYQSV